MSTAPPRPDGAELRSVTSSVGPHRIHFRTNAVPNRSPGAPPLVLVHGLVISSLYMVPTARLLARTHPVYAPDLPGFGRSPGPAAALDVEGLAVALGEWMRSQRLAPAVLVGNSLGCQIIVALAAADAALVRGLVLAGPTMDRCGRSAPVQLGRWLLDWTREPPSLALAHLVDYARGGLLRGWRTFRHALRDPIEEKLPRVAAPTLVVRGSEDAIVPRRWAKEVASLLPRGRLAEIPGGPHVVNYTTPEPFSRLVLEFARGLT